MPMKMNEIFHRKMKALRKIYGASMEEFACELEISKTYIQNIEAGKANPTLETVQQTGEKLGIPPVSLLMKEYSDNQFVTAYKLLQLLESFETLTDDEKQEAVLLFDRLVRILFRNTAE